MVSQKIINAVFNKPENQFELQTIGIVKGVAAVAAALLPTLLFHANSQAALVNAAIFALILADPYNTLWMNTLYSEFAALLFAYTSATLLYYLVSAESPRHGIAGLLIMSLFLLGLGKIQHVLLPFVLGAIWIPILLSRWHQEKKSAHRTPLDGYCRAERPEISNGPHVSCERGQCYRHLFWCSITRHAASRARGKTPGTSRQVLKIRRHYVVNPTRC